MNYYNCGNYIAEIGIKICNQEYQNKGFGKVILSMFIRGLFDAFGYKKIILDTNSQNKRAQHVYEELGFSKVRTRTETCNDQPENSQSFIDYELVEDQFHNFAELVK